MKLKLKNILLLSIVTSSITLVGCMPVTVNSSKKNSDIEKVAMTVLDTNELVSIKETELDKSGKKNKSRKDLDITLNLSHSVKSVALDNSLLKSTRVINVLEETFKEKINDYKFIINTTTFDTYGNEQKMKILEIKVDNDEVDKIKFEHFDYRNLEKLSEIKKFNYLKDDEKSNESKDEKEVNSVNIDDSKVNSEK